MAETNQHISVIEPITPAIKRAKEILFQPFDIAKWFVIGFCAWLSGLGNNNGGGGVGNILGRVSQSNQPIDDIKSTITAHLPLIIPALLSILALATAVWLILTWLSSRGE